MSGRPMLILTPSTNEQLERFVLRWTESTQRRGLISPPSRHTLNVRANRRVVQA